MYIAFVLIISVRDGRSVFNQLLRRKVLSDLCPLDVSFNIPKSNNGSSFRLSQGMDGIRLDFSKKNRIISFAGSCYSLFADRCGERRRSTKLMLPSKELVCSLCYFRTLTLNEDSLKNRFR